MANPDRLTINHRDYDPSEHNPLSVSSQLLEVSNGLQIHIADTRVDGKGDTFAFPSAFQEMTGDPFNQLRDAVFADTFAKVLGGARIIRIDMPGVGLNEARPRTTSKQKWETARHGNIDSQANLQVQALKEVLANDNEASPVNFVGYSLGAHAALAMIMSPEFAKNDLKAGSISLVEAVNDQDWPSAISLLAAINKENEATDRYLLETHKLNFGITAYDRNVENPTEKIKGKALPLRPDSVILGVGMRKGFSDDFARFQQNNTELLGDSPLTMYRTNESGVARSDANRKTAVDLDAHFIELHPPVGEGSNPHRHPIWLSMGAVGMLAEDIAKRHKNG